MMPQLRQSEKILRKNKENEDTMRLYTAVISALGITLGAVLPTQSAADAKIYAYPASANYCPAGLQPITIAGVICCGTPNQSVSYQAMMTHPVRRVHTHVKLRPSARAHCPVGTKGCS
jgi:hypothetical protein